MTTGFARRMEIEAENIAKPFKDSIYGVACWSSSARLFDQGAERVFIGTNPGGDENDHQDAKRKGYQQMRYQSHNFNAWLDEAWRGSLPGQRPNQRSVQQVFKAMYGNEHWEKVLRNTACFEVSPFRTPEIKAMPPEAWNAAIPWFQKVLEHVKPRLIICNGNGEGLSPWSILGQIYSLAHKNRTHVEGVASIKQAVIQYGILKDTKIVALPHLSRFGRSERLLSKLEELRPFV